MTINELQDEIIDEFSQFDDWMDKYSLIIDLGNSLEPLKEHDRKFQENNTRYPPWWRIPAGSPLPAGSFRLF